MSGEFAFINWIAKRQKADTLVRVPSGDDLAVLAWPPSNIVLVGVDQVLDGVHFDSALHSPRQIGSKAMNRNLSDCAAMGCLPTAAVATVALPRGAGLDYAKALYLGMSGAGGKFRCPVVGGDTGTWDGKLVVTVTILGRCGGVKPVLRSGARVGQGIYVTGALGGSLLGRHMTFAPRVNLGRRLAAGGKVGAMIDLSDGLSRDLGHICRASGVGAIVEAGRIPVHQDAVRISRRKIGCGRSPLEHALHDGEDYELLFTASGMIRGARRIGWIVAPKGIWLEADGRRSRLEARGWEHRL